ncbi:beta-propeller domain-containing protein [Brasilonema bromeliae]|uniref:APAF-1 helical domain-containing protein n=1 Tax=Brasilonema bromeliae SPC951 TaxID=385972 RepID=A0ABX1PB11_9CYAN|nr:hypothetical protein [Brasilonema bromeliae SPC951]
MLHNRLLNAYAQKCLDGWHTGVNDGYFFQNLAYHLHEAGRVRKLQRLLLDFRWLEAKLEKTNINALLADYDFLPQDENVQLVQGALRLSAHVLNQDKTELATQLWGRLQSVAVPEIQAMLEQAKQWKATPWLRPLTPCFTRPGGALLRTLSGHNNEVRAIALTPDGKYVISGSLDSTLKVWNWQTGEEVRTLRGHDEEVRAIALTPDGKYVISGSSDETLKIWNWRTGEEVRTLKGHGSMVTAVVVTPDGNYIISGSWNGTLKVWDWQTGEVVRTLKGHSHQVDALVVTPDGKCIISGSADKTLKVWNWQIGEDVHTFTAHSSYRDLNKIKGENTV